MNKLLTIFNNRVPKNCEFLHNWSWRIPLANSNAEIVILPGMSRGYTNTSEFDLYSRWEEITVVPDEKQPCLYRVELKNRPGFVPPERGFSIVFYNGTHLEVEGFTLSTGDKISVPNQIPIRIYNLSPWCSEIIWSEIRIGPGQQYVRRSTEELSKIEAIRRAKVLNPLTSSD